MSTQNTQTHSTQILSVKQIRKLRTKSARDQAGLFFAEGNRVITQAVRAQVDIRQGVYAPHLLTSSVGWQCINALKEAGVPLQVLSPHSFHSIATKDASGIGAVIASEMGTLNDVQLHGSLGWVALDNVGYPGNLGAIMRTCDAVGCGGIILLGDTTDPYHPAAVQASMGAIFSLRFVRATFSEFIQWKQQQHLTVIGTSGAAMLSYRQADYPHPTILLMGSERRGLSTAQQAVCDHVVRIPMVGSSDSLNLAIATSVVLYEMFHQQQPAT